MQFCVDRNSMFSINVLSSFDIVTELWYYVLL